MKHNFRLEKELRPARYARRSRPLACAAWISGIAAFLGLYVLAELLGSLISVPVMLRFNEPIVIEHQLYDEERNSAFTTFGLAITIINGMLASRVGMVILHRSWRGGLPLKSEFTFLAWLIGLFVYGVLGILLFLASRNIHNSVAHFLFNILELASAAGIAWAMHVWYHQRVARI